MGEEKSKIENKGKIDNLIEAVLFVSGEAVTIKKLCEICGAGKEDAERAVSQLENRLLGTGLKILQKEDLVSLVTAPEATLAVETFIKEEVIGELSKAGLETLTIVAYQHPVSRSQVDYIRGVNSSFTLRNLIMRGLVERIEHKQVGSTGSPQAARGYLYRPTLEFMKFLGITSFTQLPEYDTFRERLATELTQAPDAAQPEN